HCIDCHGLRPRRDSGASLRTPPHHCELHSVIASTIPSLRAQRSNPPRKPRGAQPWTAASLRSSQRRFCIDCHVATLLAETEARHCEPSPVFANAVKQSKALTQQTWIQIKPINIDGFD